MGIEKEELNREPFEKGSFEKVVFVMGVSGSGKSTVGRLLSRELKVPFFDGDDYHPKANIEKMAAGIPLNDQDRYSWLLSLNDLAKKQHQGAIIATSALKESYRKMLSEELEPSKIRWVYLKGSLELIEKRLESRQHHFMPKGLLQSQFDTLEEPLYGMRISINQELSEMINDIKMKLNTNVGLVGLGVMGTSLARNIAKNGYSISLYNRYVKGVEENVAAQKIATYKELNGAQGFEDLQAFVSSLKTPRRIVLMLTAGEAIDAVIELLTPLLDPGDLLVDGGNSFFKDSQRRYDQLKAQGIHFLGMGVSGGELGAFEGPSMMPGGAKEAYELIADLLDSIAAKTPQQESCAAYIGEGGSGHFVKMVHNGIEYAEMQLIAEVFEMMHRGMGNSYEQIAQVFEDWNQGDLRSYLLESTVKILRETQDGVPVIDTILDKASHKGTGSWSASVAAELGQPVTLINAALNARFVSAQKRYRTQLSKVYSLENKGLDLELESLKKAYRFGRMINHHQGLAFIHVASKKYQWDIDLSALVSIWREGCIIKSQLLYTLKEATDQHLLPLSYGPIQEEIKRDVLGLQSILKELVASNIPTPCLSSANDFYKQLIQEDSSASLIQAQRDFFGAHGYEKRGNSTGESMGKSESTGESKRGSSGELHRHQWNK